MLNAGVRRHDAPSSEPRVAVLCSRHAPGLSHLLEREARNVVCVVSSDPECVERERLSEAGVPLTVHDIRRFYAARGARLRDLAHRPDYDRVTAQLLAPHRPDLVILCGYLHIVTTPLLEGYPDRVINIHDSDLTQLDAAGRPKYRGLHAVRDAVFAGEHATRSTVHVATPDVDFGPLLVRSWAFPTHPMVDPACEWAAADILKAYAYAHRGWMMRASWGPLLATAITLYGHDQVRMLDGRAVLAGAFGPQDLLAPGARGAGGGAIRTVVRTGDR